MDYNNRVGIDLHVHSSASDGSLSPIEILSLAVQLNLGAVAITDHDTIDGAKKALAAGIPDQLHFVTGVEISASRPLSYPGPGSFHLLGYAFRLDDPDLNHTLKKLQNARQQRNPRIIERLNAVGVNIDLEEVSGGTGEYGQLGRPHIAATLVKKGIVASIDEAFDRFLGTGKPAYVDKYRVDCARAIKLIADAGGIPVLAHPGLLDIRRQDAVEALVLELKEMGLKGIEAYYPEHTKAQTDQYLDLAIRHNLLVTGGTDFHGSIKPEIQLGFGRGNFHVPYELFEKLTAFL